ncbi:DUF3237 domain-containing protein [Rhizobium leguminosarum]|uniref:DUF3237 domain-containing protein n=1 Tax=Rhizobium leguminosarum TaxID=384 RepID=UPI001C98446F|nr:DUF3237 domain-containing protein [Rhizobium leguminosarum]MBY5775290.1 DUF3237 domain-containing protein [Rhizobium leguminosarum]
MNSIELSHLFTLRLRVADQRIRFVGNLPSGRRVIAPIDGGDFEGERLRGSVLCDGADWARVGSDGVMEIDARVTLRTHDDSLIYIRYWGFGLPRNANIGDTWVSECRTASSLDFHVSLRFETGTQGYAWLNHVIAIATGTITQEGPRYEVYGLA